MLMRLSCAPLQSGNSLAALLQRPPRPPASRPKDDGTGMPDRANGDDGVLAARPTGAAGAATAPWPGIWQAVEHAEAASAGISPWQTCVMTACAVGVSLTAELTSFVG